MNTLDREQCDVAIAEWINCCGNYAAVKNVIPINCVFNFQAEEIDWMKKLNENSEFCTEIGVHNDRLIAILCPLDAKGHKIIVNEYPYSSLEEMKNDIVLTETKEYVVIKNAVLSKDLKKIDNNSNMYFPILNAPMLEQDKAVAAIEAWRNSGLTWFYRECNEFNGSRIFRKFYVPSPDLISSKSGLVNIICSFGLKFSDVYQSLLPTLIFISFYDHINYGNTVDLGSIESTSNTYDWSNPCPPVCQYI